MKSLRLKCLLSYILGIMLLITTLPGYIHANETTGDIESISIPQISGPFYLQLNLAKSRLYVGERSNFSMVLYIDSSQVNNIEIDKPFLAQPEFQIDLLGSSVRNLEVNNEPFQAIRFQYRLTPLKKGKFTLGPYKLNFPVVLRDAYSKKGIMELISNKATINVLALPASSKSINFSGGVGYCQVSVNATPRQVLQGEPIKVTLKISGSCDLTSVSPPVLQTEKGFKVFPAQKRADLSSHGSQTEQAVFEQILIPTDTQVKNIAPYDFSFFNPSSGAYQTVHSAAIPVSIKPNPKFKDTPVASDTVKSKQLAPLQNTLGLLCDKYNLWINLTWIFLFNLLVLFVLIWALYHRKRQDLLQSDTPQARAIRAANKAQAQLSSTRTRLNDQNTDEILDHLHLTLREFIGERFNLPASGMTSTVVYTLVDKGIPDSTLSQIRDFFDKYDQHCFAGTKISQIEIADIQYQVEQIINSMNELSVQ